MSAAELEHRKLPVYTLALELAVALDDVAGRLARGRGDLSDQLRRAAFSVALNIAEGAAEFSAPEKARFYRMARRSAAECSAALDVAERLDPTLMVHHEQQQLTHLCASLTLLVKAVETRA